MNASLIDMRRTEEVFWVIAETAGALWQHCFQSAVAWLWRPRSPLSCSSLALVVRGGVMMMRGSLTL